MTEHNEVAKEGLRIPWKPVSVVGLVTLLISIVPIHDAMYDGRYVRADPELFEAAHAEFALKHDVVTLAEAEPLKDQVAQVDAQSRSNSKKLDAILISSAVQLAIAAEDRYERVSKSSTATEQDIRDARANMVKTKNYRDCLLQGHGNCDALRVW